MIEEPALELDFNRLHLERFPDTADWCGHYTVSLRTWTCPDCDCPLNEQAKKRLQDASTIAPAGHLWVFVQRPQSEFYADDDECLLMPRLFTDRSKIARLIVRQHIDDAKSLRERMKKIHWYQGVFNQDMFEGWDEEEPGEFERPQKFELTLEEVDIAG